MNALPPQDAEPDPDFEALRAKYEQRIFNVIYRSTGDKDEADELTQETFRSALRHYDRLRDDERVYAWLFQIARNLCINRVENRIREHDQRDDASG